MATAKKIGRGFLRTVAWIDGSVVLIDQTKLPNELIYVKFDNYKQVASAIKNMIVRGAPAIGVVVCFWTFPRSNAE